MGGMAAATFGIGSPVSVSPPPPGSGAVSVSSTDASEIIERSRVSTARETSTFNLFVPQTVPHGPLRGPSAHPGNDETRL
jgi:hypothetical protein